jgi:hypothetical protein
MNKSAHMPHDCSSDTVFQVNGPRPLSTVWFCLVCLRFTERLGGEMKQLPAKARPKLGCSFETIGEDNVSTRNGQTGVPEDRK